MEPSNEKKILVSEIVYQAYQASFNAQLTVNYSFNLPPAHPKCREFSVARVMAYTDKLRRANDAVALKRLADALDKVMAQPSQGAWHKLKAGWAGHTFIVPLQNVMKLNAPQMAKLCICMCRACQGERRRN